MPANNDHPNSTVSESAIAVPDGFTLVNREDGPNCIVPEYLVPATNDAFDGYRKRVAADVREKSGGVSMIFIWGRVSGSQRLGPTPGAGAGVDSYVLTVSLSQ